MSDPTPAAGPRTAEGRALLTPAGARHFWTASAQRREIILAIEAEAAPAAPGDMRPCEEPGCEAWQYLEWVCDEHAAAPAALDEALTLLRMAAPRSAIGGAAYDGWLGEVAAFLREYEKLGRGEGA